MPEVTNDHDLLIRIDTKLGMLGEQIHNFELISQTDRGNLWRQKAGLHELDLLVARVDKAADVVAVEDHEKRLRSLERYTWLAIGALAVLEILFEILNQGHWHL